MLGIKHVGEEPNFLTLRDNFLNLNDSDIKEGECTLVETLKRWFTSPLTTLKSILKVIGDFFRDPGKRICNFVIHFEFFWRKTLRFFFPTLQPINDTIHTLSYASINETLICLDDLERTSLNLKDLLGVISELKEQKNCKVVLIFNDDKVKDVNDLEIHNEKVIDIRLGFDISADEACSLVFGSKSADYQKLSGFALKLEIRNIRILEKICWFYGLISPLINEYESELIKGIQNSLVLFTYASFERDEKKVPPLDYIAKYGFLSHIEEKDESKQRWSNILSDYEYAFTDELDLLLIETVKNGYVDSENFKKLANEKNESIKANAARQSFTDAWQLYHNDLDITEEKLVETLVNSFNENIDHITPINLNGTVTLLRELDRDQEADDMISDYVEARRENTNLFDPNENHMLSEISDERIKQVFKEVHKENSTQESAEEVLSRLAHSNGWNPRDEIVLLNTPKEEFIRIFKEQKEELSAYIDACMRFGRAVNATEDEKKITAIVKEALTDIAMESRLNKLRMKKYGINLEKNESQ